MPGPVTPSTNPPPSSRVEIIDSRDSGFVALLPSGVKVLVEVDDGVERRAVALVPDGTQSVLRPGWYVGENGEFRW